MARRLELASLFLRRKVQCQTAEAHRLKLAEFERYLLCSPLPDPWKPAQLTNYLAEIGQQNFGKLGHIATLTICDVRPNLRLVSFCHLEN